MSQVQLSVVGEIENYGVRFGVRLGEDVLDLVKMYKLDATQVK